MSQQDLSQEQPHHHGNSSSSQAPRCRAVVSRIRHGTRTPHRAQKLCRRCQKMDFDAISRSKPLTKVGAVVRRWPANGDTLKTCPFCELLAHTYGSSKKRLLFAEQPTIRSFSAARIRNQGWSSIDATLLALGERGPYLVPQKKDAETVRILGPLASLSLLSEWVTYCRKHHTQVCGMVKRPSPLSSISTFKVIDCRTRQIIRWTGQPFATLSYVWGAGSTAPVFSFTLPKVVPNTIEDAIIVSLALDIGYLWVDRYCINNGIPEELADQVSKMDLVYRCSEVTIIATGQGAEAGLPGVREERIVQQPRATVGKHHFVSSMEDPTSAIKRSKWWTRGWTYQEGILARRRIIFTDQQVYFECGGMYCCEALNFDLAALHTRDGQRFKSQYGDGVNLGLFSARFGYSPWEVVERIQEYSDRILKHPSDAVEGVSGVLRALENSRMRLHHFFGVPLLPCPPRHRKPHEHSVLTEELVKGPREWSLTAGFCIGLAWRPKRELTRLLDLPSWSWAGWAVCVGEDEHIRPVEWAMDQEQWRDFQVDTSLQLWVHTQDGRIHRWDAYHDSHDKLTSPASSVLDMEAWVTPMAVICDAKGRSCIVIQGAEGLLEWKHRGWVEAGLHADRTMRLYAIHLGTNHHMALFPCQYVLVVALVSPGVYERVGLGIWTYNDLRDLEPKPKPKPNVEGEDDDDDDEGEPLVVMERMPPPVEKRLERFRLR